MTQRMFVIIIAIVVLCAIGAGCYGLSLINWSSAMSCPKGERLTLVSEIPIRVGKTVVLDPIYSCE